MSSATVALPNAMLFVLDPDNDSVALTSQFNRQLVVATPSCVAIGTQPDVDGETNVSLDVAETVSTALHVIFSGSVATPTGRLAVVTSHLKRLLEVKGLAREVVVTVGVDDCLVPGRADVAVSFKQFDVTDDALAAKLLSDHFTASAALITVMLKNLPDEVRTRVMDAVRNGTGTAELRTRVESNQTELVLVPTDGSEPLWLARTE